MTTPWRNTRSRSRDFFNGLLGTVRPNAAHLALVELERGLAASGGAFTLVTQNVDDLHERAGTRNLLHMHGELAVLRCERCGNPRLRPDVVWFGETPLFLDAIDEALATCTHFMALGTSGVVYPAAGLLQLARLRGARTWVQALERPENTHPEDVFVAGRAAEVLPALLRELFAQHFR